MQFVMRKLQNINSLRNCVNSQAIALVHTNILIKALNQRFPSKNKVWDWVYTLFHCCSVLFCSVVPSYCKHYNDLQWVSRMNSCVIAVSCRIVQCDCPEKVLCP